MEFDVFISHSSKDKTMADAVCAKLEQAGIRCWIAPRDIAPGMTWSGEIMKAIDKCKVMVLVFSSNANESVQIVREVESAVHLGKPILPFRIENIQPSDSMAFFMNSVHWLDAISEPHERFLDQLVQAVGALLGSGGAPKIAPPINPSIKIEPVFDWRPIGYAAATVVVLAVLAGFFWKSKANPSGIIPASQAGSVDPSMTGVWYLKTSLLNLPAVVTANYDPKGVYKIETVLSDEGTYVGSAGHWTTKNQTGTVQQGTYRYIGPHTLEMTGPAGTAQWTDDFSAVPLDPNNPNGVGTWQTTQYPPNSPSWNMTMTNRSDGTYSLKIDIIDQGTFSSANGQMTMISHTMAVPAIPSTYRSTGQDSMEFTGPVGSATWSRKRP